MRTLGFVLVLLLPTAAAIGDDTTQVPFGATPTLDGTLDDDEWDDALEVELHPAGTAYLKHDGTDVHVGIRAAAQSMQSLGVFDGKQVRILHASASLGTAAYDRNGDGWARKQEFEWACRRRGDDETARGERKEHRSKHGWVGSIAGMGTSKESEMRFSTDLLGDGRRLAVVSLEMGGPGGMRILQWPAAVADGAIHRDLLMGRAPSQSDFEPEAWAALDLAPGDLPAVLARARGLAANEPVKAWRLLVKALAQQADDDGRAEAEKLRASLERRRPVKKEALALRRFDVIRKWIEDQGDAVKTAEALRKLRALAKRDAGTLAAELAREKIDALAAADD